MTSMDLADESIDSGGDDSLDVVAEMAAPSLSEAGSPVLLHDAALPIAKRFVDALPLVRVVIPQVEETGNEAAMTDETRQKRKERRDRRILQIDHLFEKGFISHEHESRATRGHEEVLHLRPSLYLHAGRPHKRYGESILIFSEIPEEIEAAPFGVGNLFHSDACAPQCITSIHSLPDEEKRSLFECATWRGAWRSQAAIYVARTFGLDLHLYFSDVRPECLDERISPLGSREWSAWTIEARAFCRIDLCKAIEEGWLMYFCVTYTDFISLTNDWMREKSSALRGAEILELIIRRGPNFMFGERCSRSKLFALAKRKIRGSIGV